MEVKDYAGEVAPGKFSHVPIELKKTFQGSGFPDWVVEACALHFFVHEGSSYSRTGLHDVVDPEEMLHRLDGDCKDQSVLLASLYRAVGLDVRLLFVAKPDSDYGHAFPEVYCPVPDVDLVCSVLEKFYQRELDRQVGEVYFEESGAEPGFWLLADPEGTSYVGDIERLREERYVRDTAGGGWEWYDLIDIQHPT